MPLTRRTAIASLLLLPAAAQAQDGATLRIGDQRGGIQPLMQAAGTLRGLSFDLQWSRFASAPTLLEALNAGAIDAGSIGDAPFAAAVEAGVDMKAVSATRADAAVTAVVVPAGSTIRDVADLKDRRIATLRGQTGHFLVLAALERAHLSPNDVHFVFLSPADAKVAMASGAVDAWATWGPYISMAKLVDGAREIGVRPCGWTGRGNLIAPLLAGHTAARSWPSTASTASSSSARWWPSMPPGRRCTVLPGGMTSAAT